MIQIMGNKSSEPTAGYDTVTNQVAHVPKEQEGSNVYQAATLLYFIGSIGKLSQGMAYVACYGTYCVTHERRCETTILSHNM